MKQAETSYAEALGQALRQEMQRDADIILIGEDIGCYGGAFGVSKGLWETFGPDRVLDTPISENGFVGLAVGAALTGLRPVVEIMFADFITLAMDQLVNQAARMKAIYGLNVPLVLRTPSGGGRGYGPTHSQSPEAWLLSVPGLKVFTPYSAADAAGLLRAAIADQHPVVFIENKLLYSRRWPLPLEDCPPPGRALLRRRGSDVCLIAYSRMVGEALQAAEMLGGRGIEAEVVDLRTLVPLDMQTVSESVARIGRALLVEEGCRRGGVMAEIGFRIFESVGEYLDAPLRRLGLPELPVPAARGLESALLPDAAAIVEAAVSLLREGC